MTIRDISKIERMMKIFNNKEEYEENEEQNENGSLNDMNDVDSNKKINIKLVISSMMQFFSYDGSKLPSTYSEKVINALYSCKLFLARDFVSKWKEKELID